MSVVVTADMLSSLKKEAEKEKNAMEQFKGRLTALQQQEEAKAKALAEYGVTPETAMEKVKELEVTVSAQYTQAMELLAKIKGVRS